MDDIHKAAGIIIQNRKLLFERPIVPDTEVEEIRWLNSELPDDIQVGSIFGHEILPRLKAQNLVD